MKPVSLNNIFPVRRVIFLVDKCSANRTVCVRSWYSLLVRVSLFRYLFFFWLSWSFDTVDGSVAQQLLCWTLHYICLRQILLLCLRRHAWPVRSDDLSFCESVRCESELVVVGWLLHFHHLTVHGRAIGHRICSRSCFFFFGCVLLQQCERRRLEKLVWSVIIKWSHWAVNWR